MEKIDIVQKTTNLKTFRLFKMHRPLRNSFNGLFIMDLLILLFSYLLRRTQQDTVHQWAARPPSTQRTQWFVIVSP